MTTNRAAWQAGIYSARMWVSIRLAPKESRPPIPIPRPAINGYPEIIVGKIPVMIEDVEIGWATIMSGDFAVFV